MREIKFRAAYKLLNTVYDVSEIMWSDQTVCLVNKRGDHRPESLDQVELLQFTGLKDKNGVEVFQGDVIRCYKDERQESGDPLAVVEYQDYNACFGVEFLTQPEQLHTGLGYYDSCEVIGNIYENPELLA